MPSLSVGLYGKNALVYMWSLHCKAKAWTSADAVPGSLLSVQGLKTNRCLKTGPVSSMVVLEQKNAIRQPLMFIYYGSCSFKPESMDTPCFTALTS